HEDHVDFLFPDPFADAVETLKDRLPGGAVLFAGVLGKTDGGGMRGANAADDASHVCLQCREKAPRGKSPEGKKSRGGMEHIRNVGFIGQYQYGGLFVRISER